jgi:GH24 family phage-related lysozyme (muramidase)
MTIANVTTLTENQFYDRLSAVISQLEGNKPAPYYDTAKGSTIPTIGIGFNLQQQQQQGTDHVFNAKQRGHIL